MRRGGPFFLFFFFFPSFPSHPMGWISRILHLFAEGYGIVMPSAFLGHGWECEGEEREKT